MDSPTTFAIAVGTACALALVADVTYAVVRVGRAAIRRADAPWRLIVGSTVCAAILIGPIRPVGAATPPPTVRLVEAVVPSGSVGVESARATSQSTGGDPASTYRVERGDSLWRIARGALIQRGLPADGRAVARLWPAIYEANRAVIGADPDLIHPGQQFVIPDLPLDDDGGTNGA